MVESQSVLAPPAKAAVFLVVTVLPGGEDTVRGLLEDVAGIRRSVAFRAPDDQLTCVVGIGSAAWDRLFGGPRPRGLHPFVELNGERHRAPSTPGDLLFHVRARRMDLCFEMVRVVAERLAGAVAVVDEVHGFKYFDERDLLGFVDGSENPEGQLAADSVFVGDEDPEFAGGSYVTVQKYLHDMNSWNALPPDQQDMVIGRRKLDNVELSDDVKPEDSHVAVNTVTDDDGNELKIVRDNMPFGRVGQAEFGTYFIGYSSSPDVIEQMLRNMFLGTRPGLHDRILDFSTAVTGSLFYVPTADFLDDLPDLPSAPGAGAGDGSLGIGSLKGVRA
ncbi:Dyp-type peroxidase [Streptomyces antibioticus]|uniref:Peroxidase n=1 Tax=Streptomyces antibioticus TaxID=1890 RepID=A0AAE7CIK0_STRAT|nr:Dyp-type peroxidase [Streptomyces antibioticus]MCX5166594.1 Dyp-type peroxidase [Streptomyces antibioticus]OOQ54643.1 peroxidase [Streptomyces antibioticus]QIT42274.1 Dyp-type peroxidase [Streptomyces antibioticus]